MLEPHRRRARAFRTWLIYRLDRLLALPPLAQLAIVFALSSVVLGLFALLAWWTRTQPTFGSGFWWSLTHLADGGTMASDPPPQRVLGTIATGAGILTLALLTAALTSKMGERIGEMRAGLLPVAVRDHVLVLGFAPTVPLVGRELARSRQRLRLVVLAQEAKDRVELLLRSAQAVPGGRLETVVRTGDPRYELALVRVAADRARTIVVVPPASLADEESVRWTLAVLLALRRVVPRDWSGRVLVEVRHEEALELLSLASEPELAGPGALRTEILAVDRVIAQILAQSTRQDGLYFVLRHLLAFDGSELYVETAPRALVGKTFDEAHAALVSGVLVGLVTHDGDVRVELAPAGDRRLGTHDRLVVLTDAPQRLQLGGALPRVATDARVESAAEEPELVTVLGQNATLPHLLEELATLVPVGSDIKVFTDEASDAADAAIARAAQRHPRVAFQHRTRPLAHLARQGDDDLCRADAVVILGGGGSDDDIDGDASALATLLRLRKAIRASGHPGGRIVTEVRDPRSATHIEPRPGDAVVSSDVVAMRIAQGVLDADASAVYDELLSVSGANVHLVPRERYVAGDATFSDVMAAARARGEVALGLYPDPRPTDRTLTERRRLEEGDTLLGDEAWLHPPRATAVPVGSQIAVLIPRRGGAHFDRRSGTIDEASS